MSRNDRLENYVRVSTRIAQFHEKFANSERAILTKVAHLDFGKEAAVMFAEVKVDGKVLSTGHSTVVDLGDKKALEKAETVAVGRALAFAGFEVEEAIASEEEMEDVEETEKGVAVKPKVFATKSKGLKAIQSTETLSEETETVEVPVETPTAAASSDKTQKINDIVARFTKAK